MPMRVLPTSVLLALLAVLSAPLGAQQPSHACASLAAPAARLACYDEAFPLLPEVAEAAARRARDEFGLVRLPESPGDAESAIDQQGLEQVESRVLRVDRGRDGQRIVILENGQVWAQTGSHSSGYLKAGDLVQVRKGLVGGYALVMSNGVTVRVRRTR